MLSILICVYNTKHEYLETCLESIAREGLSDYEVCLLDDGSTVDYSDLVRKYGLKYRHIENRGMLNGRMEAFDMSSGDYIAFIDSDDTVSFNYHRPMLECAMREGADLVLGDWAFHTESSRYYSKSDPTVSGDISADGDDVLRRFFSESGAVHAYFVLWNKVYRRDLFQKVRDRLRTVAIEKPGYNYADDALISFFVYRYAKSVRNVHTGYYFYRIHSSQSISVVSRDRLVSHIELMSYALDQMRDELKNIGRADELMARVDEWAAMMSRTHYSYALAGGYTDLYPMIRERYGVTKLSRSTLRDGRANSNNVPLPENFLEIDQALSALWKSKEPTRVAFFGKIPYIKRTVDYITSHNTAVSVAKNKSTADVVLPRPRISLKKRIIYHPVVYKTGMLLFKKGSKLRALIKKKL